jgi:hypothetical protein
VSAISSTGTPVASASEIRMAQRHAAHDDLGIGNAEMGADDPVVAGEGLLGTGGEAMAERGQHDAVKVHAEIEPRGLAVQGPSRPYNSLPTCLRRARYGSRHSEGWYGYSSE